MQKIALLSGLEWVSFWRRRILETFKWNLTRALIGQTSIKFQNIVEMLSCAITDVFVSVTEISHSIVRQKATAICLNEREIECQKCQNVP
jgi:hypothetical protein